MIEELFQIEKDAYKDSIIHRLDARVKIVLCFAAIIALVAVPYSTMIYTVGVLFFIFVAALWLCTNLPVKNFVQRIIAIVPLWGIIILFQIFLKNKYYTEYHVIYSLPLGISVYAESVEFAFILFVKFIVCISFIILLSSTTKMQDLLDGGRRMGLPAEFALALGMMIRYLFVFGYMYRKIKQTLETRCFDPFDRRLSYRYRLRQLGYTIGTMFIRSYEQGERVFVSMLCRGYGKHMHLFLKKKDLTGTEWGFLATSLAFIIATPMCVWITQFSLF
ncbi:MAG: Energy-coupling factor transporter transmembrane protein EcfT [Methanoregula sp. PtaU1.Bin051]|nr:MAG: Energy-coupling factor transporter transmembrane protein EcfT [Methanoregula sp. PtaU1.Bin051]